MKLSAPISHLKRKARLLSRDERIPLHQALDRVAVEEGYRAWSLLAAKLKGGFSAAELFARLEPGDLMLLGARPGQGKTVMSIKLCVEAMRRGSRAVFFTLEYTKTEIADRFDAIGAAFSRFEGLFGYDCSDAIFADSIMAKLASAPPGTLVVVDYLQLLDQRRENPELETQVRSLKSFARDRQLIVVLISQIDRSYDPSAKPFPDARDVRLPNPLDLRLFSKTCFMNDGGIQLQAAC